MATETTKKTPRSISKCSFPECGKPHESKGYCQGHYRQHIAGRPLRPLKVWNSAKGEIECERCGHVFYPRTQDHLDRCSHCRGRFATELSKLREKSRTAPAGKRWCQGCERYRAVKFFPGTSARCKPCFKVYSADQRAQKVYSLKPGVYLELYDHQGGKCYICQRATGATRALSVDHDHSCCPGPTSCGQCVRGLLCGGCNYKILGHLRDDVAALERAIEYLKNPPAQQVIGKRIAPIEVPNLTLNGD